jgi:hypothetical protein
VVLTTDLLEKPAGESGRVDRRTSRLVVGSPPKNLIARSTAARTPLAGLVVSAPAAALTAVFQQCQAARVPLPARIRSGFVAGPATSSSLSLLSTAPAKRKSEPTRPHPLRCLVVRETSSDAVGSIAAGTAQLRQHSLPRGGRLLVREQ